MITLKSNPIPTGWAAHKLANNNTKKFSLCCEDSRPHIRFSNLGSGKGIAGPQGVSL